MLFRTHLFSLLAASTLMAAACAEEPSMDPGVTPGAAVSALFGHRATVYLDQGWDDATREAFYQTTEGSRMLPYDWFLHLEQAGSGQLLRSPQNMRRMGYLVDEASATNPDQLPVGFARDVDPAHGDAIGLTCAGCHTGQVTFHGKKIRIDGGQSFGDIEQLQQGILGSLEATLASQSKFKRFAKSVLGHWASREQKEALRAELETARTKWEARIERSAGITPHGPTRTDAFTIIGNEVVCDLFKDPRNCAKGIAPTQFPPLWNTSDFEWVQYNSSVHSPIGRNVGQVTGTFAEASLDLTSELGKKGRIVDSSADVVNLHKLESWVKTLRSPVWPEHVLGSIDHALAAEGAIIYERDLDGSGPSTASCAGCHTPSPARTDPNRFGKTFARVDFSTPLFAPTGVIPPQGLLGTDPTAALSFAGRRAFPGPFEPFAKAAGLIGADDKVPVAALLSMSGTMILERFFATTPLTDIEKLGFLDFRESRTPTSAQLVTYKARPLNGIAFTAPYLHNGSVASLYELLLPPAERMKEFYVGSQEFDPFHVGFSTCDEEGGFLLDTTAKGNGNGGHVWGTDLPHGERMALIEHLKTL